MKITIESTTALVDANGVQCRVWEGVTSSGIPVACLIARVAVPKAENAAEFERELKEQRAPTIMPPPFPLRLIL